ncbi:uncharacterized protein LOC141704715 [Apium graveolens]|uniref:uncharacterized protein LOC141704715 n=1 Tax=Apium graveolens TaxID=4045 RepID=UPI003D7AFC65
MGDTLNSFNSRLNTVERRRTRRGRRFPRHGHALGKAPVVEGDTQGSGDNPRITPRRLQYSDDVEPIVELADEDTEGRERPHLGNQVVPHPHRSGCTMDERRRVENAQSQDEEGRDLSTLKKRLGIRRGGAHSAGEAPAVIPVASHSVTGNGSGARPHDQDGGRTQVRMQNNDEIPRHGQDEPRVRENIQNQNGNMPPPQPQGEGRRDPPPHPGGNQGEFQQVAEQPQQPNVQTIPGVGTFNVNDLKRLLNHLEGERVTATAQAPSPFAAVVREAQLPAGYRNTTNDLRFHGNSDPVEFLGRFNIEMDVYQVPDLARCRLLAATFREGAQQWFQKLGPGVITSWEQMKTLFLTQFQAAVKYTPPVTTLANVKQKEGESLTSYFKRFNAESTLVRGATDETLKILLIAGLRVGTDFWKHLQGKDPVSLADVLAHAESFKAIEQSLAETKKNDNTYNSKGRSKRRDRSPDRLTSWQSRDKKKYCDYHESTGHDTHECRHLRDEIEELIKAGHLGEWIDKVKRRRGLDDKGKDERQPPWAEDVEKTAEVKFQRAGSIRAIFGGHPFVGDSNRALERNAREARHPPLTNIHSLEDRPPKVFKGESADITFREKESRWVHHPHNGALVITMLIGAMNVHRVFLDNGSSTNILYYSTYKKLGFPDSDMYFEDAHVYGFTGEAVRVMGSVRLPVTLGEGALSVTQMIDFKVLDQDSAHNVLVGRPWLRAFRVITSIHHLMIKFPTPNGVGSLRGSQYESRDCYHKDVKEFHRRRYEGKGLPFEDIEDIHTKPSGEVHAHYFVENPGKEETNTSGNSFVMQGRVSKIRSVEEVVVSHTGGITQKEVNGEKLEGRSEILQGLGDNCKVDAPQKKDAPLNEVEVDAPPNEDAPSDEKVEIEDPRDFDFDLDPRIPMLIEKTGPAEDTISIPRLVNMMFKDQIGRTMEVYVDDMLVKSEVTTDHIKHLMEMFNILRRFRMKLNPQKCVFGVESGKFLGFIVNHRGIEANPAKIKALLDMKSPTNVKQVQSLTGRIAALNRFVSKSSDRCKEFFKAIRLAGKDFVWTAVLVREEDGQQSPVYYVSKRLHDAETRYTNMEKLVYALILASRKLRPYFQAHRVEVRTAYPLRQVLHKPESSGRMLKWAVELGQFDLEYVPRTAIKGQALANFLLEFDSEIDDKALVMLYPPQAEESLEEFPHPWFGIPYKLVSDNGKQFDRKELRQLCEELKIKKEFAAVYHPQSNGQTEAGTYHLEDMDGKLIPRAWNAEHLRKYYQ